MQTFSKFALIYVSIEQLARYFMGGFVIFFFPLFFPYYWLTFIFRLVVFFLFFFVCLHRFSPGLAFVAFCFVPCVNLHMR